MKNIAIYAGTFDPISLGHIDLIRRALHLFDEIIIAIASNPSKKPLFTLEERIQLTKTCFLESEKISVKGFDTLLLDFAKAHQAKILLRGLRTVTDFEYEFQLAGMNRMMDDDIETVFLMPDEKYMSISSTLIREIAQLQGDVSKFVPRPVQDALKEKFKSDGT